jgi:hypothetical protein
MSISLALTWLAASMNGDVQPTALDPYAGRNGEAEALADIARGRPTKVYYRGGCGDRCVLMGVGLANCEPDRFDTQKTPNGFFVGIPEAFIDSSPISPEQHARRLSAYLFAKAYNYAMFRERKGEILKICPQARLGD